VRFCLSALRSLFVSFIHSSCRRCSSALAFALAFACSLAAAEAPVKSGGVITISATGQPTTLPTTIPTTMEGVTAAQIERSINASDSEDALKYLPSLLVRKRYIGDYNHAILSSRASAAASEHANASANASAEEHRRQEE
jgi:iron complex outermembrane receptor protein